MALCVKTNNKTNPEIKKAITEVRKEKQVRCIFVLPASVYKKFKLKTTTNDTNITKVLVQFVKEYIVE